MNNQEILDTLKVLRGNSRKRKFVQSIDFVINLKGVNLKKPEEVPNNFVVLPHSRGKETKVAALVGGELAGKAKDVCDLVVSKDDFVKYAGKTKEIKKLAKNVDIFLAQANLMPDIARVFGKVLGPIGKMPSPKAGAVVPPTLPDLKPVVEKLKKTVKVQAKNEQVIKVMVGKENMNDEEIIGNMLAVYNNVLHFFHDDTHKFRNSILKLSMGRPFIIGKKYSEDELVIKKKTKKKKDVKKEVKVDDKKIVEKKKTKVEEDMKKAEDNLNKIMRGGK